MEFRLIYKGILPAAGSNNMRTNEKHTIRKTLHQQLKELWSVQAPLSVWTTQKVLAQNSPTGADCTVLDVIAHTNQKFGFRFVPLVTESYGLSCDSTFCFFGAMLQVR